MEEYEDIQVDSEEQEYNSFVETFNNHPCGIKDIVQEKDYLLLFVRKYEEMITISLGQDELFLSLQKIVEKCFFEHLMNVYNFDPSHYFPRIGNSIIYTPEQIQELEDLIPRFKEQFRGLLYDVYLKIARRIPDNIKPSFSEFQGDQDNQDEENKQNEQDEQGFRSLEEFLKKDVITMKERLVGLPNRFLTALLFRYIFGIGVLPWNFHSDITRTDAFRMERDLNKPYNWKGNYINNILFRGFKESEPGIADIQPIQILYILRTLLSNEVKFRDLAEKTVIYVVKGRKGFNTITERNLVSDIANNLVGIFNKMNERTNNQFYKYLETGNTNPKLNINPDPVSGVVPNPNVNVNEAMRGDINYLKKIKHVTKPKKTANNELLVLRNITDYIYEEFDDLFVTFNLRKVPKLSTTKLIKTQHGQQNQSTFELETQKIN